jgi:hypothetical protein
MKKTSRRSFINQTTQAAIGGSLLASGIMAPNNSSTPPRTEKNIFVHHVYFWLKNKDSKEDRAALIKGLQALSKIDYIKLFHIGQPADTNREVIDTSYSVSWLLFFNNKEEEERYQKDPVHLKFVEDCKHLWTKVTVYDSVDI